MVATHFAMGDATLLHMISRIVWRRAPTLGQHHILTNIAVKRLAIMADKYKEYLAAHVLNDSQIVSGVSADIHISINRSWRSPTVL